MKAKLFLPILKSVLIKLRLYEIELQVDLCVDILSLKYTDSMVSKAALYL